MWCSALVNAAELLSWQAFAEGSVGHPCLRSPWKNQRAQIVWGGGSSVCKDDFPLLGVLWVVTAASESKEEKGLTQLMGAHLLSVVLGFVSKLANRFLRCWFYMLRMISVPQCATASHRVVTEAVVCRGSVQNHLLNRNLLMRHAQCGCCVIPFLSLNGNITETFCWNGSCWSQSSNGSVKERKIRESVVAPSPLTVGLLCSALGPSFGKNRQIDTKAVAGQQNCCCSGKTSTLHFLAVWAVHVSGLFFMLQWFLHSSPLSPSVLGHFGIIFLYVQRGKLVNIKQCPENSRVLGVSEVMLRLWYPGLMPHVSQFFLLLFFLGTYLRENQLSYLGHCRFWIVDQQTGLLLEQVLQQNCPWSQLCCQGHFSKELCLSCCSVG